MSEREVDLVWTETKDNGLGDPITFNARYGHYTARITAGDWHGKLGYKVEIWKYNSRDKVNSMHLSLDEAKSWTGVRIWHSVYQERPLHKTNAEWAKEFENSNTKMSKYYADRASQEGSI